MDDFPLINCDFPRDRFKIFSYTKFPTSDIFFEHLKKYNKVLLLSLAAKDNNVWANLVKTKDIGNRLYCINHEVDCFPENSELDKFFKDRTFVLRDGIQFEGKVLPYISPVYFGEYENLVKSKNDVVTFVCIKRKTQLKSKIYEDLFQAFTKLKANGYDNFKLVFTGSMGEDANLYHLDAIKENMEFLGRVPYDQLYALFQKADFMLFNIDLTCEEYMKYLKKGITGAYLNALGFALPAVVEENIAREYDLKDCSIAYSDNLYQAIEKAVLMNNSDYLQLRQNLQTKKVFLMQQSLLNIKKMFKQK